MSNRIEVAWSSLNATPILWPTLTLMCYLAAIWLYRRCGNNPLLLPVLTAVMLVVGVLIVTDTPYDVYARSTSFLTFLIGPATVALAVPLYSQFHRLKQLWWPICIALFAGSLTAILSAVGIAWALGASNVTLLSLAPKSVTMPIAMEVAQLSGGLPSFTTVAVAITGISGAIMAGSLLKWLRITDPVVEGFALGVSAHAIGTARALQKNEVAGAFAALGMGLNGVITAILVPLLLALSLF
jgi:predicted murein hydrolase (TIGR00659 family)